MKTIIIIGESGPKAEAEKKPERFDPPVLSPLGGELVDIVNVLRGLGVPEDEIIGCVRRRI